MTWMGRMTVWGLSALFVAFPVAAQETSLCDIAAAPDRYDHKVASVEAHIVVDHHGTYLYSHSCPRAVFGFDPAVGGIGDAAVRLRRRLALPGRMVDEDAYPDYYLKFTGEFRRFSAEEKADYPGAAGYFVISDVAAFVPEAWDEQDRPHKASAGEKE